MQIQVSWFLQKPNDLDLHSLQRQGISGFSTKITRVKTVLDFSILDGFQILWRQLFPNNFCLRLQNLSCEFVYLKLLCSSFFESMYTQHSVKALIAPVGLLSIAKTRLYSFDPLKPHFYTAKLGLTAVYIIFLISAQKHRLWVIVRTVSSRRF